jgi:hypothetical protein
VEKCNAERAQHMDGAFPVFDVVPDFTRAVNDLTVAKNAVETDHVLRRLGP